MEGEGGLAPGLAASEPRTSGPDDSSTRSESNTPTLPLPPCLVSPLSDPHRLRPLRVPSPSSPKKKSLSPQLERSRITRLVSHLANSHRPTQAAPSARVAHSPPLTWFVSGFYRRFRRTYTVCKTISVRFFFPFSFRIRRCCPFLDHHFHIRCPRAQRHAPHDHS